MAGPRKTVSFFTIGEEVNLETEYIRIRIVDIERNKNTLVAKVIKAEGFFAENHTFPGRHFEVGMRFALERRNPGYWVCAESGKDAVPGLPWFVLGILSDGTKSFKHYR